MRHNAADWAQVQAIRTAVFVVEQRCPPPEEWDAFDRTSTHILMSCDGEPIGTARWRLLVAGEAKLERFAVLREHRGAGYGRRLVTYVLEDARAAGATRLVLHAQARLEAFYESFGFQSTGTRFVEAGIDHVEMRWDAEVGPR